MSPGSQGGTVATQEARVGVIHDPVSERAHHIRALILLGGSVRAGDLSRSIQRSILDLPVEPRRSVLAHWGEHVAAVARALGLAKLPVRVITDKGGQQPAPVAPDPVAPIHVEVESASFRGTGGVLRDATIAYAPEDLFLVANAAQILVEPLANKVLDLLRTNADASIIAHADGAPAGLFLLRCSAVRGIKDVGYIDFKEQVLPKLAQAMDVRVVPRPRATGLPIRTRETYLAALRTHHRVLAGKAIEATDPFAEDWFPSFAVAEDGSQVAPDARIHDSVILSGARLEPGSVVVRCVVCAGGVVRAGATVTDQIITGARTRGPTP